MIALVLYLSTQFDTDFTYSYVSLSFILLSIPRTTLETITGNMLGDGSIGFSNASRDGQSTGNARYAMTMSVKVFDYLSNLYNTTYAQYSNTGLKPYPNVILPQHVGKSVTQYGFYTQSLPIFTELHSI
jgi:hypothetical protein